MNQQQYLDAVAAMRKDRRISQIQHGLINNNFIRTINYHSTPAFDKKKFEGQLQFLSRYFAPVKLSDIDHFVDAGRWDKDKPGVILAIFEGFRNHYDVMYPLLEEYGMTGWFYIPAFYPDVPVQEQKAFSEAHELHITHPEEYPDGRFALNWDEIKEISKNHMICCHSGSHFEIKLDSSNEDMEREIVEAHKRFKEEGLDVDVFCWLYGEEYSYNPRAAEYIQKAGYRYVVGNLKMERVVDNKPK